MIGNTKQAPYLNSLRAQDPEEECPLYPIDAANIGDLIAARGESWKAYLPITVGSCPVAAAITG